VTFEALRGRRNRVFGGMSGQGGVRGPGGRQHEPLVPFEMPSYGAGVYCGEDAKVMFKGCTFEDNATSPLAAPAGGAIDPNHRLDPYIGYGGGVASTVPGRVHRLQLCWNVADTGGGSISPTAARPSSTAISSRTSRCAGRLRERGRCDQHRQFEIRRNRQPIERPPITRYAGRGISAGADAQIQDCEITDNASGGGLYLRGENTAWISTA
jgi:hypothetical protein